jgi:beta-glucosidase
MSGEATSRSRLDLPGRQLDLVKAIHATGTPTAVVLFNGRPLAIGWVAANVPAILEAWYPGVEAGHALADVLFGDVNPGGKLPVSVPRTVGEVPVYYDHMNTGRPPSATYKYTSKYIDLPIGPLWPFGHGLSYARFRLSGLKLDADKVGTDGRVGLSVAVKNEGTRPGDEVVQVYIRDVAASVVRPVRELKRFERVTLAPGESRTLRFALGPEDLGLFDLRRRFVVEPGAFLVFVGTSSEGGLEARFEVER